MALRHGAKPRLLRRGVLYAAKSFRIYDFLDKYRLVSINTHD